MYPIRKEVMDKPAPKTQEPPEDQQDLRHETQVPPAAEVTSPKKVRIPEQMKPDPPAIGEDPLAVLKSFAELSAVFVGLTYIGGWAYVATYYRTFGLNALELDLPLPVVCTSAAYMLFNVRWPLLVIAALLSAWMLLARWRKLNQRIVTIAVLVLLLFTVSTAGATHGRRQANDDMLADSSELPNVAFSTRLANDDQPPCVGYQTYGILECKLLLHSKGTYYFFTPIRNPDESLAKGGNLNVYTLADSDVTGMHILRGIE
ncbi:MAG: hypothetical protein ACLQHT_21120 [Terracidiphilus sp.]